MGNQHIVSKRRHRACRPPSPTIKVIKLSKNGRAMLAQIQPCRQATAAAADSLDAQRPYPLSTALEQQPFGARIGAARGAQSDIHCLATPPGAACHRSPQCHQ